MKQIQGGSLGKEEKGRLTKALSESEGALRLQFWEQTINI